MNLYAWPVVALDGIILKMWMECEWWRWSVLRGAIHPHRRVVEVPRFVWAQLQKSLDLFGHDCRRPWICSGNMAVPRFVRDCLIVRGGVSAE